jgi:hypothetical protein
MTIAAVRLIRSVNSTGDPKESMTAAGLLQSKIEEPRLLRQAPCDKSDAEARQRAKLGGPAERSSSFEYAIFACNI